MGIQVCVYRIVGEESFPVDCGGRTKSEQPVGIKALREMMGVGNDYEVREQALETLRELPQYELQLMSASYTTFETICSLHVGMKEYLQNDGLFFSVDPYQLDEFADNLKIAAKLADGRTLDLLRTLYVGYNRAKRLTRETGLAHGIYGG